MRGAWLLAHSRSTASLVPVPNAPFWPASPYCGELAAAAPGGANPAAVFDLHCQ
jgi:hypothetical protein